MGNKNSFKDILKLEKMGWVDIFSPLHDCLLYFLGVFLYPTPILVHWEKGYHYYQHDFIVARVLHQIVAFHFLCGF